MRLLYASQSSFGGIKKVAKNLCLIGPTETEVKFTAENNILKSRTINGVARTHIKWRLLDQAVDLFNCVPFQNGSFS